MIRRLANALYANAYLLLTLVSLFWAGNFVVGRGVHGDVPPVALAWTRWLIATLIILPFALKHLKRDWPVIRANWLTLVLLGIVGVGCFNTFAYIGLNDTTALNALVLQSSGPVLIALTCFIVFADKFTPKLMLGIAVSLAGVMVIVTRGDPAVLTNFTFNKGDLWILAALGTWAIYTAFLRKRPNIHFLSFTATTFFVGMAVNTPLFLAEHYSGWQMQWDRQTMLAVAYVTIFPGILAYIFYNRSVELIGGTRSGLCLHLVPVFGAALAILFLGETLRIHHVAGFALVLMGVATAARKN